MYFLKKMENRVLFESIIGQNRVTLTEYFFQILNTNLSETKYFFDFQNRLTVNGVLSKIRVITDKKYNFELNRRFLILNASVLIIDRLTPMPRTLLISITLMSIWLKFGETVTQKVGNMILRSYPGTS